MAKVIVCVCALLLALTASVTSQLFADLFQGYQPFAISPPTLRPIYDDTSRRIKTEQHKSNYHRGTTRYEQILKNDDGKNNAAIPISSIERDEPVETRRKKTTAYNSYSTTAKPRKIYSGRRVVNSNRRDQTTQVDYNNNNGKEYGKVNSINDYYTQKPNYGSNNNYDSNNRDYEGNNNYDSNNRRPDYDRNNYYTTKNPLINRPGVRPAVVDNRPPITNRPVTRKPNYGTNPTQNDDGAIAFPGGGDSPQVTMGPDEDLMSRAEKKRYVELAERMCDKYKALTTKAVQAIPLLPSPEPVRVNVSGCAPVNVPLVVGGRVVKINEFPHMALLGWRKLESAGYSWKCGGSLVSEQFVLTAAHCSYQDRDNTVVDGPPRAVQLGSSYLNDPGALVVRVSSVIRHPKYKQPRSYYDLALVKLENVVKFSEVIKPACLGVPPATGQSIIATGWGRTEYGGDQSHELRSVSLPIWSMEKCREVLGTSRKLPDGPSSDSQVCAGEERGGKDTCQGDSGGPAQLQDGCVWRVVAVTSLGRSCGAAETPGLYAIAHRAFIASQIFGNQKDSENSGNYDTNNRQQAGNVNYDSNNRRPGVSNVNYDTNNRQQGGNVNYDSNNRQQGAGHVNYDSNNRQQVGYTTQRNSNANYDGQNYNRPDNNVNYKPDNQIYSTQRPDRNTANYYGTDNQQNYNTQRPNRNENSGIIFDYNNRNEYTTRKPIQTTTWNSGNINDYTNNNSPNYENNNRGQTNYDSNNNYGSNNDNYNDNQGAQNNYNRRPSYNENYTVNRPWWSK